VSVHIRQVGDWTQALGARVGAGPEVVAQLTKAAMKGQEKDEKDVMEDGIVSRGDFVEIDTLTTGARGMPAVRIDGPYGAPAEDVFNVEVAVLVGAGIGVLSCLVLISERS
jgi:NADPH oxidase